MISLNEGVRPYAEIEMASREEIEFRFFKLGGRASGRFAVATFALLAICAMIAIIVIVWTAPHLASVLGE